MRHRKEENRQENKREKTENARAESCNMVACLVYYRTTVLCWAATSAVGQHDVLRRGSFPKL